MEEQVICTIYQATCGHNNSFSKRPTVMPLTDPLQLLFL